MKLGKWIACLAILVQVGSNSIVNVGEVVGVSVRDGEKTTRLHLQGGGEVHSDWAIEQVLAVLLDREVIEKSSDLLSVHIRVDNALVDKIRKLNDNTIFEKE